MTRILLKTLNAPALIFLVILGIAVQTSLFASYPLLYLQPDVVLLVVIWISLKRPLTEGGMITLILASFAEIHSSAPQGLFLICYMSIYLLMRAVSKILVISNLASLVILTLIASIFFKSMHLMILYLMNLAVHQWKHTLILLFPGAAMEGIVSIWIYRALDYFDWITYKNPKTQRQLSWHF